MNFLFPSLELRFNSTVISVILFHSHEVQTGYYKELHGAES